VFPTFEACSPSSETVANKKILITYPCALQKQFSS